MSGVFLSAYQCAVRVERLSVRHERPARFLQLARFGFRGMVLADWDILYGLMATLIVFDSVKAAFLGPGLCAV